MRTAVKATLVLGTIFTVMVGGTMVTTLALWGAITPIQTK